MRHPLLSRPDQVKTPVMERTLPSSPDWTRRRASAICERSVGELNDVVPLSQSALSQQLARLRQQGLVDTRRESQTIHYRLADGPARRIIELLHEIYCGVPATE